MNIRIRNIVFIIVLLSLATFIFYKMDSTPTTDKNSESNSQELASESSSRKFADEGNNSDRTTTSSKIKVDPSKKGLKSALRPTNTIGPSRIVTPFTPPASMGRDIEKYINEEFPGEWIFQRDNNDQLFRVLGGKIPVDGDADAIAQTLSDIIAHETVALKSVSTEDKSNHYYQQTCKGLDVFKGLIRIYTDSNGQVTMINPNIFPINCNKFDPSAKLTNTDAQDVAANYFNLSRFKKGESIIFKAPYLMIWASLDSAHLAYLYRVTLAKPFDIREIVIDAKTGEVLADNPLIVN